MFLALGILKQPMIFQMPYKAGSMNYVRKLTKFDATGDEGRVQATVSKLNDFEINKLIEDIVSLNDDICMKLALTDETYQDIHQS